MTSRGVIASSRAMNMCTQQCPQREGGHDGRHHHYVTPLHRKELPNGRHTLVSPKEV